MKILCTYFFGEYLFLLFLASPARINLASAEEKTCDSPDNMGKISLQELFSKPPDDIVTELGGIYEHSSWVVTKLTSNPQALPNEPTITDLANAMKQIVNDATYDQKLALLKAHPDLNQKLEKLKELTPESQEEQARSGLGSMTSEEEEKFTSLNSKYKSKFGFPFILAVRNASKHTILAALEGRLGHTPEVEFADALAQVHKIAWMRLLSKIDTSNAEGYLTCHVLDTANGIPAAKMRIELRRLTAPEGLIGTYVTNSDGRLGGGPALKGGKEFLVGEYEWTFYAGDYFASVGTFTSGTPFLDVIPLRFGIDNPDDHYHVPLLVSPFSFSTYRGS